ncbi:MAG: MotA/TolQ/ExbB proton channel family protein [Deltaproteobacteria bacterium]|nr:MAG: MotA/TolQ/ExbB proton channel family protein [Deltaproteobacteria bacterium]
MDITKTLLNLALGGSAWVLWLLIILSIASVAVMIERGLMFYRGRFSEDHFVDEIGPLMAQGAWSQAMDRCQADPALEPQVLRAGLQKVEQGKEAVQEAMESERIRIGLLLGKRLPFLGTLGANAPFIGLLGTVLGIIHAFKDLALTENGGGPAVMAGIAEALVATAVGLLVAIPAVVAYNYFHSRLHVVLERSQCLGRLLLTNLPVRPETENLSFLQPKVEGRR